VKSGREKRATSIRGGVEYLAGMAKERNGGKSSAHGGAAGR